MDLQARKREVGITSDILRFSLGSRNLLTLSRPTTPQKEWNPEIPGEKNLKYPVNFFVFQGISSFRQRKKMDYPDTQRVSLPEQS